MTKLQEMADPSQRAGENKSLHYTSMKLTIAYLKR